MPDSTGSEARPDSMISRFLGVGCIEEGETMGRKKRRVFRGWWIVAGGFFIMATCYAVFVNCLNLFLVPITQSLHISRAQFNANSSIAAVVGVVASLLIGRLIDRRSARLIGILSVMITAVDMFLWSFVTALWQMYILSFVTGFVVISGTRLLISILIANWFEGKRGLAVSVALSGSGVGGVVMSQLCAWLIATQGWRPAFVILSVITLVLALPLTLLFRNRPADLGLSAYGTGEGVGVRANALSPDGLGLDRKTVVHSGAFWVMMAGFFFMGLINGGVIINISANFTDAGHTAAFAANVVSAQMFVLIVGKITLGAIYDRFGIMAGTLLGSVTTVLATASMLLAHTDWAPYLFALCFGFGTCLGTVAPPLMVVSAFGNRHLGSLVGYVTAIEMFGVALGAIMMGRIYDTVGTYAPGWSALTAAGAVMTAMLLLSVGMARKLSAPAAA